MSGSTREITLEILSGHSAVGGGAAPDVSPETALIAVTHTTHSDHELEEILRRSNPPIIARVVEGKVLIDLRTVSEKDEDELFEVLISIGRSKE